MTEYWNRCSSSLPSMEFPILPVTILDLIIRIFRLQKYVILLGSPLGLFSFSSLLHFIIILLSALQNVNAFWNQVPIFFSFFSFLIPLFSLIMIPFFFSHIFVNHFLPLDSSQFLLFENTPLSVSHYLFCALLWYFWLPAEVVLHLIPHFLGTEEKRMNKREKGARETCSFYILTLNLWLWGPSRNVVNEMINIQSMWLLSYFSFPPPPMGFFFLNSLHSVHCCSSILLLEWELYAGNCMSLWHRLRPTLDTHWQTVFLQRNWNTLKKMFSEGSA